MAKVIFHAVGRTWDSEVPVGTSILEAAQKVGTIACDAKHVRRNSLTLTVRVIMFPPNQQNQGA